MVLKNNNHRDLLSTNLLASEIRSKSLYNKSVRVSNSSSKSCDMNGNVLVVLALCGLAFHNTYAATANRTFPSWFRFGAATASYQVEGGWNADGKGESTWDHVCHNDPDFVDNEDNGDIACDSYHKYKDDVAMLKELGVEYYRFSLSWPRIIPLGLAGSPINQAGITYYKNLLQELIDNDIEPLVTMFHWDTPQTLEDIGGWPNPEIADHFEYYARVVFDNFGDMVQSWMTFNEPLQTCHQGYGAGTMAPGIKSGGLAEYKCAQTLLRAHAKAYHLYDEEYRETQNGVVGIVVDTTWFEPASGEEEDLEAAERALQMTYGWYVNPVVHGNWPQVMIDRIGERSKQQGYSISRLPEFTDEDIDYIKGTHDFIAINAYTTEYTKFNPEEPDLSENSRDADINVITFFDDNWQTSASSWLRVVPWGLRKLLNWLDKTYDHPEIFVTENGISDTGGLDDQERITYYKEYLNNVLDAILDDGVNVTRYTAWSLMDNFEWARGYTEKFGMYAVNFSDPDRPRTQKASGTWYSKVIATRCLEDSCQ